MSNFREPTGQITTVGKYGSGQLSERREQKLSCFGVSWVLQLLSSYKDGRAIAYPLHFFNKGLMSGKICKIQNEDRNFTAPKVEKTHVQVFIYKLET